MGTLLIPGRGPLEIPGDVQEVSDSFHTFRELYEHRNLLFCVMLAEDPLAWKSRTHADGTMFEGWFIAGTELPTGSDITYHLPIDMWDLCPAEELDVAPPWDGHTPAEVCERLRQWLEDE